MILWQSAGDQNPTTRTGLAPGHRPAEAVAKKTTTGRGGSDCSDPGLWKCGEVAGKLRGWHGCVAIYIVIT